MPNDAPKLSPLDHVAHAVCIGSTGACACREEGVPAMVNYLACSKAHNAAREMCDLDAYNVLIPYPEREPELSENPIVRHPDDVPADEGDAGEERVEDISAIAVRACEKMVDVSEVHARTINTMAVALAGYLTMRVEAGETEALERGLAAARGLDNLAQASAEASEPKPLSSQPESSPLSIRFRSFDMGDRSYLVEDSFPLRNGEDWRIQKGAEVHTIPPRLKPSVPMVGVADEGYFEVTSTLICSDDLKEFDIVEFFAREPWSTNFIYPSGPVEIGSVVKYPGPGRRVTASMRHGTLGETLKAVAVEGTVWRLLKRSAL